MLQPFSSSGPLLSSFRLLQRTSAPSLLSLTTRSSSNIKDLTFTSVVRNPKLSQLGISQLKRAERSLLAPKSNPPPRPTKEHQEYIKKAPTSNPNQRVAAAKGTETGGADPDTPKNSHFWNPIKKLSRAQMDQLRLLHHSRPLEHNIGKLSKQFGISPMAVKRILRSKFRKEEPLGGGAKTSQ